MMLCRNGLEQCWLKGHSLNSVSDALRGMWRLQNLALNVAEKGFPISVYNRTYEKTQAAESRAQKEGKHVTSCITI